ncbi:hypothetical protein TNCV_2601341 [Trichonephila clavipes]|nr:hypothetical protein TNCV_2601341 [Trichonephila clavipes]
MHMKCPPGKDSWCFYRRALAKEKSRRVNIAVSEAVSEYNFGTLKALKEIQKAANLDLGEEAVKIAATRDYRRKKERNRQSNLAFRIARRKLIPSPVELNGTEMADKLVKEIAVIFQLSPHPPLPIWNYTR